MTGGAAHSGRPAAGTRRDVGRLDQARSCSPGGEWPDRAGLHVARIRNGGKRSRGWV